MISKELLSEVLGFTIETFEEINHQTGMHCIYIYNSDMTVRRIENIYELAYRCKEWARDTADVEIFVFTIEDTCVNYEVRVLPRGERDINESVFSWWNFKTEYEAVFKACEWLLEKKKTL